MTASGLDGVLVIDKPAGMTSHDVVAVVRRALGGRRARPKVGHTGTLDPDATGVLVVCLGRATRLVPYLQAAQKTYAARLRLGVTTTTLDAAGDVLEERDASAVDEGALLSVLAGFVGVIEQVPPMVSALKIGGERLHVKARRGEVVERAPRPVTIAALELVAFHPGVHGEANVRVVCSPGTYVRTLAADVGERLGVGASLCGLRRLASGTFAVEDAVDLATVQRLGEEGRMQEVLVAPAEAVGDHPSVTLDDAGVRELGFGRPVPATGYPGAVAALDPAGRLVAMIADAGPVARPLVVLAPAP